MAEPEIHAEVLRGPEGLKARTRAALRRTALSALGRLTPNPTGNFVRCLSSHWVFDDQIDAFRKQIRLLKSLGTFVDTDTLYDFATGARPIDGRYFHLSFDDGLGNLLRNAAPVLQEEGVPAIVFVTPHFVTERDPETRQWWFEVMCHKKPVSLMDWDELARIREMGFEIGAHTRTHTRLSTIADDPSRLEDEIAGCKADIEARMGAACDYFAWPYGSLSDISPSAVEAIRAAGFKAAFGAYRGQIVPGQVNLHMLPRHHVEPHWPLPQVRYFALGGREDRVSVPDW